MRSSLTHAIEAPRTLIVTMAVINEGPQMNVADLDAAIKGGKPPRAPLAFRVGVLGHRPNPGFRPSRLASILSSMVTPEFR